MFHGTNMGQFALQNGYLTLLSTGAHLAKHLLQLIKQNHSSGEEYNQ